MGLPLVNSDLASSSYSFLDTDSAGFGMLLSKPKRHAKVLRNSAALPAKHPNRSPLLATLATLARIQRRVGSYLGA